MSLIKVGILVYFAIVAYIQLIPESLRKDSKKSPTPLATEEVSDDLSVFKVEKSFATRLVHRLKSGFKAVVGPLKIFVPGQIPVSEKVPSKYAPILVLLAGELSLLVESGTFVGNIVSWKASGVLFSRTYFTRTKQIDLKILILYRQFHQLLPVHKPGFRLGRSRRRHLSLVYWCVRLHHIYFDLPSTSVSVQTPIWLQPVFATKYRSFN